MLNASVPGWNIVVPYLRVSRRKGDSAYRWHVSTRRKIIPRAYPSSPRVTQYDLVDYNLGGCCSQGQAGIMSLTSLRSMNLALCQP
jgi:hypothetical protein